MGVTIKEIALEAGVSWPAVSQILKHRGRFSTETRERVLAVVAKHKYKPNSSARALRQQSSKLVGVLFRNDPANALTNMTAFEYLLGINQRFQDADLATLLIRAGELAQGDTEPRVFRERLVDGVIVVGAFPGELVERVRSLSQHIIWLDAPVWTETCCVRRDEHAAGFSCGQALVDLGYKKICFLGRDVVLGDARAHHSHASREAGARQAAEVNQIQFETIHWPEMDPARQIEALEDALKPDVGIIAGSLPIARRMDHGAASLGYLPGYDYGMVCCDDSYDVQACWNGLCRVEFNRYGLGEKAAEMMLSLLADPENPPVSYLKKDAWCIGNSAWGPSKKGFAVPHRGRK